MREPTGKLLNLAIRICGTEKNIILAEVVWMLSHPGMGNDEIMLLSL